MDEQNINIDKKEIIQNKKDEKSERKKAVVKMSIFLLILLIIGGIYGAYWIFYGRRYIKTENAYVNSSQNVVTSQISGRIKEILAENTQEVKKGQLIAVIDDTDYKIALENAEIQAKTSSVYNHPDVQKAVAAYKNAYVNLIRTKVYAPEDGKIVKKAVFLGQQVNPSQELLTIINLKDIWVDANLKETQMKNIKIGDRVKLKSDINGKVYSGYIQGISAGTGSALSLLPAQNATGNWIKIVQRVPVRIIFDEDSLKENGTVPVGSSMTAEINTDIINKNIVPYKKIISSLYEIDENILNEKINKIIENNMNKN